MTTSSAERLPSGTDRAASQAIPCLLRPPLHRRAARPDNGARCRLTALLHAPKDPSACPTGERPTPHLLPGRGSEHGSWLVYAQAQCTSRTSSAAVQRNPLTPRTARDQSLAMH